MKKRWLSFFIAFCMVFTSVPVAYAEDMTFECTHHPEHTVDCGYAEAVAGNPCEHEHDADCGYGVESCACEESDEEGNLVHTEDCETTISDCMHEHDEACGYAEATEEVPCAYQCEICAAELEALLKELAESAKEDAIEFDENAEDFDDADTDEIQQESAQASDIIDSEDENTSEDDVKTESEETELEESIEADSIDETLGICEHHKVHTEDCSYDIDNLCENECEVCYVQELIDNLPDVDDVIDADYDIVLEVYDTYEALTEEEKEKLLNAEEVFEDLFKYFNRNNTLFEMENVVYTLRNQTDGAECFLEFVNGMPILSPEQAKVFMSFVCDTTDSVEGVENSKMYKLLTGNVSVYGNNLLQLKADLITMTAFIRAQNASKIQVQQSVAENAAKATSALAETFLPGSGKISDADLGVLSEYQGKVKKYVEQGISDFINEVFFYGRYHGSIDEAVQNIKTGLSYFNSIESGIEKGQKILNGIMTGVYGLKYACARNLGAAYTYFDHYLKTRPYYESSSNEAFRDIMETYSSSMGVLTMEERAVAKLCGVPDWTDALKHIDRWAEYVYAIEEYTLTTEVDIKDIDHNWSIKITKTDEKNPAISIVENICDVCGTRAEESSDLPEELNPPYAEITDWILTGKAKFNETEGCFILTEEKEWQTGAIWYNYEVPEDFVIEFDYYTGVSTTPLSGADGISLAFYADFLYTMEGGEQLGFNGSGGYGVELDTYRNYARNDPNYNHIAVIDQSVGNHLKYVKLKESEDGKWHHLRVQVIDSIVTAYIDGNEKLTYKLERTNFDRPYLGITSATGDGTNYHKVKNIKLQQINSSETEEEFESLIATNLSAELLDQNCGKVINGVTYDYKYQINAGIYNGMSLTAKKATATLDISGADIALEENTDKKISLGNIAVGATKNISWIIYAVRPDNAATVEYGVTTEVDGKLTFRQMNYFNINGYAENSLHKNDWWSFSNSQKYYGNPSEGYYISANDYDRLIKNLDNADIRNITWSGEYKKNKEDINGFIKPIRRLNIDGNFQKDIVDKWTGSCYAMSTWVCLVKAGVLTPTLIQSDAQKLNEVDRGFLGSVWGNISKKTESAINYYHFQQCLKNVSISEDTFFKLDQRSQLSILEDKVSQVENGGVPVLLSFYWYDEFDENGKVKTDSSSGHSVVAYGMENGRWNITSDSWKVKKANVTEDALYDKRILIYDCSAPDGGEQYHLYYSTEAGIWCIPGWKIISTESGVADTKQNNGFLSEATNDIALINSVDYQTGEVSSSIERNYTTITTIPKSNWMLHTEGVTYEVGGFSTLNSTDGEKLNIFMDSNITEEGEMGNGFIRVVLPNQNESYTVESEEDMSFSAVYENYFEAAFVNNGGSIIFSPEGTVEIQANEKSDYYLTVTANEGEYTLPWHTIEVTGNDTEVVMDLTEQGVVLKGNNLTNVTIQGSNDDETVALTFNTDEDEVLIGSNQEKDALVVNIDLDGNGDFETPLANAIGVSLNKTNVTLTEVGAEECLRATITPANATNKAVTWISSDPSVATVDNTGKVTAVANGTAVITVTTVDGGYEASCTVTVNIPPEEIRVTGVSLNKTNVTLTEAGAEESLTATITPADATNQAVTWTSSDSAVATVDNTGKVTAVANGTATITVTTVDGGYEASCEVTVAIPKTPEGNTGGNGSGGNSKYSEKIAVSQNIQNGSIEVTPKHAYKGQTVTITAKPDVGYQLEKLTVSDKNGNQIELKEKGDYKYSFIMPASEVKLDAEFIPVEEKEIESEVTETVWQNPFADVKADNWFYTAVEYVQKNNLMVGTKDIEFSPFRNTNRGMLVTILWRLAGSPIVSEKASSYQDVASDAYYANAIAWAAENGIVSGHADGTFKPADPITREQLAVILYRYVVHNGYDAAARGNLGYLSDADTISAYATEAMAWAVGEGIFSGDKEGKLNPKGSANRAETASVLMRFIENIIK